MNNPDHDDEPTPEARGHSRRRWLGWTAAAGAAVVGGAIGGGAVASAQDSNVSVKRQRLLFDVACLGETFRDQPFPDPPELGDTRGTPFSVEGWIYPGETILGEGFVPSEDGSIGRWFCAGFGISSAERPLPHVYATANFVFGTVSETRPFPPDTLVTTGLGVAPGNPMPSSIAIVGGSGEYSGALGQAGRVTTSLNTTVFFNTGEPAPNFRYTFDLMLITA